MKTTRPMMMILLSGVLALGGCSKAPPPAPVAQGVKVDLPKLQEAFATANADCQAAVAEVAEGFRYGEYPRAFAALDKLNKAPDLTEPQKKIVAEVTEQFKALASKAPTAPPR